MPQTQKKQDMGTGDVKKLLLQFCNFLSQSCVFINYRPVIEDTRKYALNLRHTSGNSALACGNGTVCTLACNA